MNIEPLPQPRIDTLVRDAATGADRRRTEYVGTVWVDGRPEVQGSLLRRHGPPGARMTGVDVAFFLPDSLPYRREALGDAQLTVSAALQGAGDNATLVEPIGTFVDDPGGGGPTWVQLRLVAYAPWPFGLSYRVVALTRPDAAG